MFSFMRSFAEFLRAQRHPVYHSEMCVERRTTRMFDRDYGMTRDVTVQRLVRKVTRNGKLWQREILDRETVPDDVMISLGCFGDTGRWISRFADVINAENRRNRVTATA